MILLQTLRRLFVVMSAATLLALVMTFGLGSQNSWAATSLIRLTDLSQVHLASMNRVEAIAKDIEGKAQNAIGNITGDPKDQIMGKAKQAESRARNAVADAQDKVQLRGRAKAVAKNLEGKTQEAMGKAKGSRSDQSIGRGKQAESQARNVVEDVKDTVRDIFN